jgi:hypothetical protein
MKNVLRFKKNCVKEAKKWQKFSVLSKVRFKQLCNFFFLEKLINVYHADLNHTVNTNKFGLSFIFVQGDSLCYFLEQFFSVSNLNFDKSFVYLISHITLPRLFLLYTFEIRNKVIFCDKIEQRAELLDFKIIFYILSFRFYFLFYLWQFKHILRTLGQKII